MKRFTGFLAFLGALLLLGALPALSQEPLRPERIDERIVLDGNLDEPVWQRIEPLPMTMYTPISGGTPTERTDIRIAYDSDYLYIGGANYDSDPDGIMANALTRDVDNGGDFFNVLIDTFNDNESAFVFSTQPSGSRTDFAVFNDGEGSNSFTQAWNTFWDVEVVRNGEGWFVEMRIPFTSLPFQDADGVVTMGMNVNRLVGRKNERVIYPAVPNLWQSGPFKPSQGADVVFEGLRARRPWYFTPYGLTGQQRVAELVDGGEAFDHDDEWRREVGADLKIGLTDNLTLDLTANTDFAEVEADDQRVNLTRFPLFFPERRQFFLERAGIFDFDLGGVDRVFYSRRVGLTGGGTPVRLLGGARLVGRIGEWDVGAMSVQADETDEGDAENLGVFRLRRRVVNAKSYLGTMATTRVGRDDGRNVALGVDGSFNLGGNDYLEFALATTDTESPTESDGFLPASSARLVLERRSTERLGFNFSATSIGGDFSPGLGFVQRPDIVQFEGVTSYGILASEESSFRLHTPQVGAVVILGNDSGDVETTRAQARWTFERRSGAFLTLSAERRFERLDEPFRLAEDVVVPVGDHTFHFLEAELNPAQGWRRGLGAWLRAGSFFDGDLTTVAVSPFWKASPHLTLRTEYQYDRANFDQRNERFTSHIVRLRAETAYDSKLSTNAFVQINSAAEVIATNIRLRYNFREGNDLWVVWNQQFNTDRDRVVPELPLTDTSAVTVKYTYTFRN